MEPTNTNADAPRPAGGDLIGTVLAGRYEITGTVGKGGAGSVYRATQQPLGREVAIKVLRSDVGGAAREEFERRFLREAALAGRLSHPNVVRVYDFGTTEDGLRYVAMELLLGKTLSSASKDGPMEAERAARVVAGLARGLNHAHAAGLVHRDVKPLNVILVEEDGKERPVLLDFGLVKSSSAEDNSSVVTKVGTYMGTPAYMAPEQARGDVEIDHRADIYALGCIFYRLISGKLPYEADHPLGLAVHHMVEPFPAFAERSPEVPVDHEIERIVRKCMEKERDERYQDAAEIAADLDHWLMQRKIGATMNSQEGISPFAAATPAPAPSVATSTDAEPEPAQKGGRGWLAVVAALLLLLGGGGLLVVAVAGTFAVGGAGWLLGGSDAVEAPPALVEGTPDQPEAPGPDEAAVDEEPPSEVPEAPEAPADTPDPGDGVAEAPAPAPAPAPKPAPKPKPKPAPTGPSGTVNVTGDGSVVLVNGDGGRVSVPGPVPQGRYTIEASFGGGTPFQAGKLTILKGETKTIACKASMGICKLQGSGGGTSSPAPTPSADIVADNVPFTRAEADKTLAWLNQASEQDLVQAGVYERGLFILLNGKPWADLNTLADTPGIGQKTIEALKRAGN